jgi:hypothetical protein
VHSPIHSLYPLTKLPASQQHGQRIATIVLCNVRTITCTQHSNLLLNLGNIVIPALKINLRSVRAIPAQTSLMATTSPVSLFTVLYTTPNDPFPTCSSSLYFADGSICLTMSVDGGCCGCVSRWFVDNLPNPFKLVCAITSDNSGVRLSAPKQSSEEFILLLKNDDVVLKLLGCQILFESGGWAVL